MTASQFYNSGRRIGYARVSGEGQTLYQYHDALKLAGCDVIFEDDATRATAKSRTGLQKARAALNSGDTFVVLAIDRAFRSCLEGLKFLDDLDSQGVTFHSIYQQIDTRTPEGRKWFAYQLADAEYELAVISRRTKEKMAAAKARGKHMGRPFKLDHRRICRAHEMVTKRGADITEVAAQCRVSPITLKRAFQRIGLETA